METSATASSTVRLRPAGPGTRTRTRRPGPAPRRAGARLAALLALVGVVPAGPTALAAQAVGGPETVGGCFPRQDLPRCRSFWIVELSGRVAVAGPERRAGRGGYFEGSRASGVLDVGYGWNLDERWGTGVSAGVELGLRSPRLHLRGRLRRELEGTPLALEVAPGLVTEWVDQERPLGFSVDGRLHVADVGFLRAGWDRLPVHPYDADQPEAGPRSSFSLGAGLTNQPAVWGTTIGGAGFLTFMVIFLATFDPS